MPDNFNPNGSGAHDALREDQAADATMDTVKNNLKNKAGQKGKDALKNKMGSKKSGSDGLTGGKGGAVNPGEDESGEASGGAKGKPKLPDKNADEGSPKAMAKKGVAAGKAASTGAKAALLAKIMGVMKIILSFLQQASAALASAIPSWLVAIGNFILGTVHAIGGVLASAGGAIASVISGIAAGIAGALGIGATAATVTATAAVGTGVLSGVVLVVGVVVGATSTRFDGNVADCATGVKKVQAAASELDNNAIMFENAKKIYSVMKTFGLSDEQIAGMFGNWQIESSIDPTAIEGVFGESHDINGPKHQKAMANWDSYVRGPLSRSYAANGTDYTQNSGYLSSDGKKYPGVGLAQWTGGGCMTFLEFAESIKKEWWSLDYQLAYMLAKDSPTGAYRKEFWPTFKSQEGSAGQMSTWFAQYFEGNTTKAIEERAAAAEQWLAQEKSWSVDEAYGNSVITMAKELGDVATDGAVSGKLKSCVGAMKYDNSTLANAAVSYAYETNAEGAGNDGTPLYRRVHDSIWGKGHIYQSCDYGVSTAVRWSGTDEEFVECSTALQLSYLETSDKWKKIGNAGSVSMSDLQPGDVFILNGHIFLYVGHEAVAAKYPNTATNIDSVSASFNERSPGCGMDATDIVVNRKGEDWIGRGQYQVYRCVKPDKGTKYKDAGAGSN